jgi:1-acyl-sn-glycerol-3-phosphate acyltransferase
VLLIRSLLFQIYFYASVAIASSTIVLCWPFSHKLRFAIARAWGKSMLFAGRWICGLKYVVEGRENIPQQPSVILIKHSTVLTYAMVSIQPGLKQPVDPDGLMARWPIAINRGAGHSAVMQVIEQGKARLAEGTWVTVFPEGTRVAPGKTKKYGVSGAALARDAGVKIVPVAHNAGDLWPRRGIIKKPGLIRFVIGPPIDASAQAPKETNLIVQGWIESKMREISDGYKQG